MNRTPVALVALVALAGCQTTDLGRVNAEQVAPLICHEWDAIQYSRTDTAETIRQIVGNNAARQSFCGGE